jgi:hypothetical protein
MTDFEVFSITKTLTCSENIAREAQKPNAEGEKGI